VLYAHVFQYTKEDELQHFVHIVISLFDIVANHSKANCNDPMMSQRKHELGFHNVGATKTFLLMLYFSGGRKLSYKWHSPVCS
jgi:hypothetical protein